MEQTPTPTTNKTAIGQQAPDFRLTSIQGELITLASYRQQKRVILWFSRGFTCNFCRRYMEGIISHYNQLTAAGIEVIQIAPNLLETAQRFFTELPPYPFVCDPDKRLYAIYDIGDRGVLEANKNTVVAFGTAFLQGEGLETVRASWIDVANRNFVRRLAHHALTAVEQGLFFLDTDSIIRHQVYLKGLETIPDGRELLTMTEMTTVSGEQ
ncbi:MAG: AhpC/TSA family protein [Anaerolineae bacterium]|nr:AhpC/TSA family protein [Anaerolineae bacterium]